MSASQLLKKGEAAEKCRVSIRTIDRWESDGKLPFVRIGGVVRIRSEDLAKLIESGTQ